jgi:nucleoside-diphosphate-sugar epimerase
VKGIFSCTYPDNVSYGQIARTAQGVFGQGGNTMFLKDKPDIPDNVFAQEAKLYDMIDYTPQISLEKGLSMLKEYIQRERK